MANAGTEAAEPVEMVEMPPLPLLEQHGIDPESVALTSKGHPRPGPWTWLVWMDGRQVVGPDGDGLAFPPAIDLEELVALVVPEDGRPHSLRAQLMAPYRAKVLELGKHTNGAAPEAPTPKASRPAAHEAPESAYRGTLQLAEGTLDRMFELEAERARQRSAQNKSQAEAFQHMVNAHMELMGRHHVALDQMVDKLGGTLLTAFEGLPKATAAPAPAGEPDDGAASGGAGLGQLLATLGPFLSEDADPEVREMVMAGIKAKLGGGGLGGLGGVVGGEAGIKPQEIVEGLRSLFGKGDTGLSELGKVNANLEKLVDLFNKAGGDDDE